ncbi:hypothetical protein IW261DRAFT_894972 [Armillaria novae-zelandiae]|uniref:Transmembrane protein n=1 Tax=Armillaria novae-zelandiae TaxID=153914 RepID=A0AA39NTJ1_9AGAR|nr:hypothetical protein IW261DRAFT_894972 [Armillaria novae-zelandiae]
MPILSRYHSIKLVHSSFRPSQSGIRRRVFLEEQQLQSRDSGVSHAVCRVRSFNDVRLSELHISFRDGLASTSPHDVGQTTLSLASTTLHEVTESTISTESMPSVSLISSITPTVTAVPMSPTRQSGQAAEHTHRTSVIVGATIVAVLVLVMAPFSIWYFARRHRTSNTLSEVHDTVEQFPYVPTMSLSNTVIGLEGGERDRNPRREKTHITPPIDSLIHPAPQSPAAARSSLLSPPPISPNALVSNSPQMNLDNEAAAGSLSLRVQMEELSFNPEWSTMGPPPPYVSEGDVIIRQGDT